MASILITDVLLFDGHTFIDDAHVLVLDGLITSFGTGTPPTDVHKDVQVLSKPGHTLIPGLIDAHVHALGGNVLAIEESLKFGVTTVCDMHNEHRFNNKLREMAHADKGRYADFKCAGLGATIEGGWPAPVVRKEFEHLGKPEIVGHLFLSSLLGSSTDLFWHRAKSSSPRGQNSQAPLAQTNLSKTR
jgi:hypothetical protein